MKNRGSCGLKQARYESSWRGFACRCRAVQNSATYRSILRPPHTTDSFRVESATVKDGSEAGPVIFRYRQCGRRSGIMAWPDECMAPWSI